MERLSLQQIPARTASSSWSLLASNQLQPTRVPLPQSAYRTLQTLALKHACTLLTGQTLTRKVLPVKVDSPLLCGIHPDLSPRLGAGQGFLTQPPKVHARQDALGIWWWWRRMRLRLCLDSTGLGWYSVRSRVILFLLSWLGEWLTMSSAQTINHW